MIPLLVVAGRALFGKAEFAEAAMANGGWHVTLTCSLP
jgi:hypothetical protein